jgi:glycosyltransferase involved in cell wall biosynthesis
MAKTVLHFSEPADTSGFFPQLAKWHDRSRYSMRFGTLGRLEPRLRSAMEQQGVRCLSLDCRGRSDYPGALWRLALFLRRERVDVMHTHLFDPSVVGLCAATLARTPLRVMTRHYSDYHTRIDRPWHVRLDRLCTRLCDVVIAVSQHTADHMVERESAPGRKIRVVLNGIDFDRVCAAAGARERIRRELDAGEATAILMMARLHPEKGQSHLFEALPRIKRQSPRPFVVWVAGAGGFEAAYRQQVRSLGCDDVVRFLGFRDDAADLMAGADLLVLPSVAEAFGLVLAEALYLGKPVIASRVGGIPEIVADGTDGILVPPGDSAALAAAICRLLDDGSLRDRMSGAGRERVHRRFGFESMVRSYERVYEQFAHVGMAIDDGGRLGSHHVA